MMIYVQDLLYSVMFLMLLEITPAEESEKDLFQNRKASRVSCNGTGATGTTWRNRKFQLDMREKIIHWEGGQNLKPRRVMESPFLNAFRLDKPWICFGQEVGPCLSCCFGICVSLCFHNIFGDTLIWCLLLGMCLFQRKTL